jgi:PQQ-like domain
MMRPLFAPLAAVLATVLAATATLAATFPGRIEQPIGWQGEGITAGRGTTVYFGSLATGAFGRADVRTGEVEILNDGVGTPVVGMDYEERTDRVWAAGGPSGLVYAFDAATGDLLRSYPGAAGFLNDVTVTDDAVYVTNSAAAALVVIPLSADGALPDADAVEVLPLTGAWSQVAGFNANGIVATRGSLVVMHSQLGRLYRVDPVSGVATELPVGGPLPNGDGLELRGSTLYVVQNFLNQVAVVALGPGLESGVIVDVHPAVGADVPTTAAFVAGRLWLANARFGIASPATAEFWITRLDP